MSTRKNSTRKDAPEDSWTCQLCNKKFSEDKAEVLECEYCNNHFCRACLNLSSAEYKLLNKRPDLHWYCPPCEGKALRSIKIEKEIEERCRDYFNKYEERLVKVESELEQKTSEDQVKAMIEASKSDIAVGGNAMTDCSPGK